MKTKYTPTISNNNFLKLEPIKCKNCKAPAEPDIAKISGGGTIRAFWCTQCPKITNP